MRSGLRHGLCFLCCLSAACGGSKTSDDSSASGSGAFVNTTAGTFPAAGLGAGTLGGASGAAAGAGAGGTGGADAGTVEPVGPGTCGLTQAMVTTTQVDLGSVIVSDEDEAALHPIVIAPLQSGGSRVAWMGDDAKLHIATLDETDHVFGTPFTLEASDLQDMYADEGGGVVLVSRPAQGSGDKHCGTLTNLCGNASSLPAEQECRDMYLLRFNGPTEAWAVNLTDSSADRPPYLTSPTDAQSVVYVWQAYAHHGRIAYDGSRYAAYFGAAISVSQTCVQSDTTLATAVNIHQGDRMRIVDKNGSLITNAEGFDWGCSHSGYERVIWDAAAKRFVAVCKTDNENRLALAPMYSTIKSVQLADNNVGDMVTGFYGDWIIQSDAEAAGGGNADVALLHFSVAGDTATLEKEVPVAAQAGMNERAPHLAVHGDGGMIAAWETSSKTGDLAQDDTERIFHVQSRDAASGEAVGDVVTVPGLRGNRYHAMRTFPDGSVVYVGPGTTNTRVMVARIAPCPRP